MSPRQPMLAAFSLALVAASLDTPTARAQDPLPLGGQRDATPSDPAALGFLRADVDRRIYSLPAAGARRLSGNVRVTAEIAGKKMEFAFQVEMDYDAGKPNIVGLHDPPADPFEQTFESTVVVGIVPEVFAPRPSATAADDVIKLSRDGELIRLDRRPRLKDNNLTTSTWYDKTGRPLRSLARIPAMEDAPATETETTWEVRELEGGQIAIVREVTRAPMQPEKIATYDYAPVNGYFVLRSLRVEAGGATMVAEFQVEVLPAKATRPGK